MHKLGTTTKEIQYERWQCSRLMWVCNYTLSLRAIRRGRGPCPARRQGGLREAHCVHPLGRRSGPQGRQGEEPDEEKDEDKKSKKK